MGAATCGDACKPKGSLTNSPAQSADQTSGTNQQPAGNTKDALATSIDAAGGALKSIGGLKVPPAYTAGSDVEKSLQTLVPDSGSGSAGSAQPSAATGSPGSKGQDATSQLQAVQDSLKAAQTAIDQAKCVSNYCGSSPTSQAPTRGRTR